MKLLLLLAILSAPTKVGRQGAVLRSACDAQSAEVAKLEAGTEVAVRFSMNGEGGACYKVDAGGRQGYLFAADLDGTESFDSARRAAKQTNAAATGASPMPPAPKRGEALPRLSGRASETVKRALELLDQHQPKQALRLMEYALLNESRNDAFALAVAGVAAYQSDELKRAEGYFRESLAIAPDPAVEELLKRVRRESGADSGRNVTHGERFVLRFDEGQVPAHVAAVMLDALDAEYKRIDEAIGCGGNEAITAIVQSRTVYKAAGAAEWSAAQYDGRIRVGMPDGADVSPELRRRFAHEIVHACLARRGQFPAWFHEGLAQRLTGDRLTEGEKVELRAAARSGQLPGLGALSGPWGGMTASEARMAYNAALAAVESIYAEEGEARVRDLIRSPGSLGSVQSRIEERLK